MSAKAEPAAFYDHLHLNLDDEAGVKAARPRVQALCGGSSRLVLAVITVYNETWCAIVWGHTGWLQCVGRSGWGFSMLLVLLLLLLCRQRRVQRSRLERNRVLLRRCLRLRELVLLRLPRQLHAR